MQYFGQKLKTMVVLLGLLAVGVPFASNAASVSLLPTTATDNVMDSDLVSFDVFIDFGPEGTLGGGFDLSWDPAALSFLGLTSAGLGDPAFGRDPDILSGLLSSWAVADFSGITSGLVGSMDFEVLSSMGLSTMVSLMPTNGIGGPWVSGLDFISLLEPDYNSVEVTRAAPGVIPVPAAFWLFGSAIIGFAGWSSRKSLNG